MADRAKLVCLFVCLFEPLRAIRPRKGLASLMQARDARVFYTYRPPVCVPERTIPDKNAAWWILPRIFQVRTEPYRLQHPPAPTLPDLSVSRPRPLRLMVSVSDCSFLAGSLMRESNGRSRESAAAE